MEKTYAESKPSSVPFFIEISLSPFSSPSSCKKNSNGVERLQKLFIGLSFYIFSRCSLVEIFKLWKHERKSQESEHSCRQQRCVDEINNEKKNDVSVTTKEVEMIMERLGLFCSKESECLKETMSCEEVSELFDEKEPSLDEVKEAFDVFDKNRDGFIDAEELQSVMSILGLKEGYSLERCRQMIRKFDDNCDPRIDFKEFVRFMETSFC